MQERLSASNVASAGGRTGRHSTRALAFRRRNVRTFAAIALAATGAAWLGLSGGEALAASSPTEDGAIRLLLPFPRTGPRDIQGVERATRAHRMISAHAPQPISEVLADVVVMAASGVPELKVLRVRQPSNHNRLDLAAFDTGFDAQRSIVLVSHESISASAAGTHAGSPADPEWLASLAIMPLALLVPPAAAADLERWRRQPGSGGRPPRLGSAGERSASHIAGTLLSHALSMRLLHVSYNGGQAALNAFIAAEVDLVFAALPLVLPHIEAGKLSVLGLASARRFELLPQLPTLAEAGIADIEWEGWFAVYASRSLDPDLRIALSRRLHAVIASAAVRSALLVRGLQPADSDLQSFARRVGRDRERATRQLAPEP